jgi:hypothetical protein
MLLVPPTYTTTFIAFGFCTDSIVYVDVVIVVVG